MPAPTVQPKRSMLNEPLLLKVLVLTTLDGVWLRSVPGV